LRVTELSEYKWTYVTSGWSARPNDKNFEFLSDPGKLVEHYIHPLYAANVARKQKFDATYWRYETFFVVSICV